MDKEESFCNSTCEDQIDMAERELSAFIRAVTELFGSRAGWAFDRGLARRGRTNG